MSLIATLGGSATVNAASGGKIYAYNAIAEGATTVVAPANPSRVRIRFHNPGANDLYIAPAAAFGSAAAVSQSALAPSNAALGGCFIVYSQGTLEVSGECQQAWQAFAKTGAGGANPLTVMDTNVL